MNGIRESGQRQATQERRCRGGEVDRSGIRCLKTKDPLHVPSEPRRGSCLCPWEEKRCLNIRWHWRRGKPCPTGQAILVLKVNEVVHHRMRGHVVQWANLGLGQILTV